MLFHRRARRGLTRSVGPMWARFSGIRRIGSEFVIPGLSHRRPRGVGPIRLPHLSRWVIMVTCHRSPAGEWWLARDGSTARCKSSKVNRIAGFHGVLPEVVRDGGGVKARAVLRSHRACPVLRECTSSAARQHSFANVTGVPGEDGGSFMVRCYASTSAQSTTSVVQSRHIPGSV